MKLSERTRRDSCGHTVVRRLSSTLPVPNAEPLWLVFRAAQPGQTQRGRLSCQFWPFIPMGTAVARRALRGHGPGFKEVELVKTWFVVGSAAAVTAVGVALLAGMDDIRRFRQMRKM
jgi:hypothetical protein